MDRLLLIGLIAVGIVVVIIIIYAFWYYDNRRLKALKLLAESLNFTFSQKGDDSMLEMLGRFHLFSQGHSRRVSNVFSGRFNDIPVTVMDYRYTTGGGKSSHTWQQTVLAFESDKLLLPCFVLRPENLFDKIGSVFGKKDINFETAPVFSKRYLLRGEDEESIRKLFKEWVLQYYEQNPGISTEGDGKMLIYYRSSRRVSPDKIQVFLQEGYAVFGLFKGH
jgi:hypothetical protein